MKLLFLGDLFYDYPQITEDMEAIIHYINENDYRVIVNFETAMGAHGEPIKKRGPNLKSSDALIEILKRMNCVAVCLANNHAMDFGAEALKDTKMKLEKAGILCVGAGENRNEAEKPAELSIDGVKLAIFNFGWNVEETVYATDHSAGCAPLDRQKIPQLFENYKKANPNTMTVGIFHWGFEFNTLPMPVDIALAHHAVDCGCDLVIGHHPHVTQPIEEYKNRKIYYSLGNFYLSSLREKYETEYTNEGCNNFGDYGLGVVLDLETNAQSEIVVYYDRETNESKIIENCDVSVVRPLPNVDWKCDEYTALAKQHAYKQNPILTLDERKNKKELDSLMRKYWVAEKVSFLKKSKLGMKIYGFLKSRG